MHLGMRVTRDFPIQWDWVEQDCGTDFFKWLGGRRDTAIEKKMIGRALHELGSAGQKPAREFERLCESRVPSADRRWLDLYVNACETRRATRLKPLLDAMRGPASGVEAPMVAQRLLEEWERDTP